MTLWSRFFADDPSLAQDLVKNETLLLSSIRRYQQSFEEKMRARVLLSQGKPVKDILPIYTLALADERVLVRDSEAEEERITSDLATLERHFSEFSNTKKALDHALTQERYVYKVMRNLHNIPLDQGHIVRLLEKDMHKAELWESLIHLQELERRWAEELGKVKGLIQHYANLAMGARVKHELDDWERAAADEIYEHMMRIETAKNGNIIAAGVHDISALTAHCFNHLAQYAMDLAAKDELNQGRYVLFELVNSDLFEKHVINQILANRLRLSDEEVKIFIHIFRDLYNTRIEQDWG